MADYSPHYMIELREMQFLVALAQHKHFARAAADCGVSQPAFSMRIRNLEVKLGVAIVKRGNRFQGFTDVGDTVVARARIMLDDARALSQEVRSINGEVGGTLALGVVPTAIAYAAKICAVLRVNHPDILVRINACTSLQIQQRLEDGTLDAGITYLDGISLDLMNAEELYGETYVLVCPPKYAPRQSGTITWAEVAEIPQSMLDPEMQNRRILDRIFEDVGKYPQVVAESNGFVSALVMAREGFAAAIVPKVLIDALGNLDGTVILPIEHPDEGKTMCLATLGRGTALATVEALRRTIFHNKNI